MTVATETRFESEERLHQAMAAHPEVLPSQDIGLGPLVNLGVELDLGSGPIDLLAADPAGRLVIVEFKRGSENPDVRKVVAQMLDYGSSLWRTTYDEIETACTRAAVPGGLASSAESAFHGLGLEEFDPDVFHQGVEACLDSGSFVFLYVGRDLDQRTRRIMTYLAEGPRMSFFAVEVDYYASVDDLRVLVPRTAFVPSWIIDGASANRAGSARSRAERLASAPEGTRELLDRMDELAADLHLVSSDTPTGRVYRAVPGGATIGVYTTSRGAEFSLTTFREAGRADWADEFLHTLSGVAGRSVMAPLWPSVAATFLVRDWQSVKDDVIVRFFEESRTL
ncbi:MAG: hypothetical protein ACRDQH_03730 [Pseudonocardiaceae bacterium]